MTTATNEVTPQSASKRDFSLDFLRGAAVLFMIITHVNAVFYQQEGTWLDFFTWWGATTCYTIFLFVSGAVSGMALSKGKITIGCQLNRALYILFIYYATAFMLLIFTGDLELTLKGFLDVFLLQNIPEFTEFILPFAFYPLLMYVISLTAKKGKINIPVFLIASIVVYIASRFLYTFDWGGLQLAKEVLVGHGEVHRFGLMTYFPVWALGIVWGIKSLDPKFNKQKTAGIVSLIGIIAYAIMLVTGISVWNRWPPTVFFLTYGIVFVSVVLFFYNKISRAKPINDVMVYLGQKAMDYYFYHLLFIAVIAGFLGWSLLNEWYTMLVLALVIGLSTVVIKVVSIIKTPSIEIEAPKTK